MNNTLKKLSAVISVIIVVLSLSGCSLKQNSKSIVVWSHFGDNENQILRSIADKWGKDNGYSVTVLSDRGDTRAFLEAEKNKIGPDINFGISYSKLSLLNKSGVIAAIPKDIDTKNYINTAVKAVTVDGNLLGLPINISTYALYYNKDKVATPPSTLDELIDLGTKKGFEYDVNNIYLSYGFLASQGGYIFATKNDTYSYGLEDIGLNSSGSIAGYKMLQDMVNKYKFIPQNIDGIMARTDFLNGKTAFYLNGPTDLEMFNEKKLNYAVTTLPENKGVKMPAFISLDSAFVSSSSNKKDVSFKLLKYLIDECQMPIFKLNGRLPVTTEASNNKLISENTKVKAFIEQADKAGILIPDSDYTQTFNSSVMTLKDLTTGKITPAQCGQKLYDNMYKDLKKKKEASQ